MTDIPHMLINFKNEMKKITAEDLLTYRKKNFHPASGMKLDSPERAIEFVNRRGFIFFWPIKDIFMPSLWVAAAGDRPVPSDHDDPGHVTWSWKDSLLNQRRWYYAKVLRKRATIISLSVAPFFYALSENFGSPEDDYLIQYEQGRMTQESKLVYETLLDEGPLDTITLRKATHMTSRSSDSRFNRALTDLQADFKILPVGISRAGGWNYAFIYDIVARYYPELPEQARFLQENEARYKLVELYLRSVGAAQLRDIQRLFGWRPRQIERAIDELVQQGTICADVEIEKQGGDLLVISDLLNVS